MQTVKLYADDRTDPLCVSGKFPVADGAAASLRELISSHFSLPPACGLSFVPLPDSKDTRQQPASSCFYESQVVLEQIDASSDYRVVTNTACQRFASSTFVDTCAILTNGQLLAFKHDDRLFVTLDLDVTWAVNSSQKLYQQNLLMECHSKGEEISAVSPRNEPRTLLLTNSKGWEASGTAGLQANMHAPVTLAASLKYSNRKDVQESRGAWTTQYEPLSAKVSKWSMSLLPSGLENVAQDAEATTSLSKPFSLTIGVNGDTEENLEFVFKSHVQSLAKKGLSRSWYFKLRITLKVADKKPGLLFRALQTELAQFTDADFFEYIDRELDIRLERKEATQGLDVQDKAIGNLRQQYESAQQRTQTAIQEMVIVHKDDDAGFNAKSAEFLAAVEAEKHAERSLLDAVPQYAADLTARQPRANKLARFKAKVSNLIGNTIGNKHPGNK